MMSEARLLPAEAACQGQDGVRRDGPDSFVDELHQGSGLGLADGPGDVSVVQKTYEEGRKRVVIGPPPPSISGGLGGRRRVTLN